MVKKPHRTPKAANIKAADTKRQLEDIVGQRIDASAEQVVKLRFPLGTYDISDFEDGATATWQSIFFPPGKSCNTTTLYDVSGVSSTLADGKRVFLISDVVCFPPAFALDEPINVVATPRADKPFYLTTTHALVKDPSTQNIDLQITVFAWDADGTAAPNVVFDWRCRAVFFSVL
jgi:hypothetical protein